MSKISEVSKRTGLSKRTLQYYDDEGLLHVPRSPDNYRMYDGETMQEQIELITSIQKQHMLDNGGTDRAYYIYSEAAYVPQNARGWSKRNLRGISVQITEERKQGGLKIL